MKNILVLKTNCISKSFIQEKLPKKNQNENNTDHEI